MAELAGARVLVTGAAGFIGANLVRSLLASGATVIALVRSPGLQRLADVADEIEVHTADLRDIGTIREIVSHARPDLAVNLAHPAGHPRGACDRLEQLATAALGTAGIVDALAESGCRRLVHVGSSLEYGPRDHPLDEDDRPAPTTPRGAAKAAASLVCLAWGRTLQVPALVLRPFSVYGPWEHEERLVPKALRAALDERELPLTAPGLSHDFVYVGDVVDAIVRALRAGDEIVGQTLNIGTGVQTTNEGLVATVGRVVGRPIRTRVGEFPAQPHDVRCWVARTERARAALGWEPRTSLDEGLRLTLDWLDREMVAR